MFFCKWLAILWRASLNSKCNPNLKRDVFFSTNSVISISILLPNTDDRCTPHEKQNVFNKVMHVNGQELIEKK